MTFIMVYPPTNTHASNEHTTNSNNQPIKHTQTNTHERTDVAVDEAITRQSRIQQPNYRCLYAIERVPRRELVLIQFQQIQKTRCECMKQGNKRSKESENRRTGLQRARTAESRSETAQRQSGQSTQSANTHPRMSIEQRAAHTSTGADLIRQPSLANGLLRDALKINGVLQTQDD